MVLALIPAQQVDLVDPKQELIAAGTPGWEYQQSMTAELDGDGSTEAIYILAKAMKDPNRPGEYQWDDGQPWQVYVQDGGDITRIFARWVQAGRLTVFVTDEEPARLVVAEQEGAGFHLYNVRYKGPGSVKATKMVSFPVRDHR